MAFFNFGIFGEQEHRVFNYKPRYYDPEKEALKEKFASVDGTMEKKDYVPGTYLKGAFRREDRYRTAGGRIRMITSLVGLLMVIIILILIAKIFPALTQASRQQQSLQEEMYEQAVENPYGADDVDEWGLYNPKDY